MKGLKLYKSLKNTKKDNLCDFGSGDGHLEVNNQNTTRL